MVLARVLEYVRKIVVGLAGHPDAIVLQHVGTNRFALAFGPTHHVADDEWEPLSTGFKKPESQLRELIKCAAHNQRMECAYHDDPETPEAPAHPHALVE